MLIIPAVDIKAGRCVRLVQGRAEDETVYSENPVQMAIQWQARGARRLHVVDLDGAFSGTMQNKEVILDITDQLSIPVQVGGGIRDFGTINELIDAGVSRVIMSTSAIYNKGLLQTALEKWPDRISVGIDIRSGRVATDGWNELSSVKAMSLAQDMEQAGVKEIIVTDIKKDGTLKGPNIGYVKSISRKVNISVIASGGVSNIEDIRKLAGLGLDNLIGVIVGKALYSQEVDFAAAVQAAVRNNGG